MPPIFRLSVYVCLLCVSCDLAAQDLFISPSGDDSAAGSRAAPLASLRAARDAVRRNRAVAGDVTVTLLPGEYLLRETVTFGSVDGGDEDGRVTYRADSLGTVMLSGGHRVDRAALRMEAGRIVAEVDSGEPFRQLYVNGRRATRARTPNIGYLETTGWDFAGKRLLITGNYADQLNEAAEAEVMIIMSWAESYLRVKRAKREGLGMAFTAVDFGEEETEILFNRPYPVHKPNHRVRLENALAFVDAPGEWYYDSGAEKLYYQPYPGETVGNVEIIIPQTEKLIEVAGTLDEPVRNLTFENIIFAHTNWSYASTHGYLNAQAGMYNHRSNVQNKQYVYRPPAAVTVTNASEVRLHHNIFRNLGASGVDLYHGTERCAVVGCIFRDLAGTAVYVGKFTQDVDTEYHLPYLPADEREISRNDTVSNNLIEAVARDYLGCVGIGAGYPRGLQISHNVIRDLPYSGISLGYGWTDQPNAMRDNYIAYNDIYQVVKELNDGGGIYTLSLQPNTHIYRNHLHDIDLPSQLGQKLLFGMYFDERSGGTDAEPMVVEENVIAGSVPDRINFHQPTTILIKNTVHRLDQRKAAEYGHLIGLQAPYRELLDRH